MLFARTSSEINSMDIPETVSQFIIEVFSIRNSQQISLKGFSKNRVILARRDLKKSGYSNCFKFPSESWQFILNSPQK